MPLTPEDVKKKRFTPIRFREGYDMAEVDQFLDEVEAELARLLEESNDLRSKLAATGGDGANTATDDRAPVRAEQAATSGDAAGETTQDTSRGPGAEGTQETIKVTTAAEASSAALRLLELATKNADEVVAEAKQEAQQIVGTARTEAERLEADTKSRTDELEAEARTRAQNLDAETETKRAELLGDMEAERARLDDEVENLRAFEREYRSRLKSYFTEQLHALDGTTEGGELPSTAGPGEPQRLKSILADRSGQPSNDGAGDAPDVDPPKG